MGSTILFPAEDASRPGTHQGKRRAEARSIPPIFVINLDSSTQRYDTFLSSHLSAARKIVRVSALSGLEISGRFYRRSLRRMECFFYHGELLTKGELGCCISHVTALKNFLRTSDPFAVIAEDDIQIDLPRLSHLVDDIAAMPKGWDLVKLSLKHCEQAQYIASLTHDVDVFAFAGRTSSNGAYLITRAGAEKLVARLSTFGGPIDQCFDRTWQTDLHLYGVWPPVATHRLCLASDIDAPYLTGDRTRAERSAVLHWLWAASCRPVARFLYAKRKQHHVRAYCGLKA